MGVRIVNNNSRKNCKNHIFKKSCVDDCDRDEILKFIEQ